jgi:hypothetical protein
MATDDPLSPASAIAAVTLNAVPRLRAVSGTADSPAPATRSGADEVKPVVPGLGRGPDGEPGRAAPDVSVSTHGGEHPSYVSFDVDPKTHELHISVLDGDGRVVRVIPPDSVAQMMSAMARYASTIG